MRRCQVFAGILPARIAVAVAASGVMACGTGPADAPSTVSIFAAASLKSVLGELAGPCGTAIGVTLRSSYAASSTLARQIEEKAEADLFISADLEWMDYVAARQLVKNDTRVNLVGNRLILIAPRAQPQTLTIAQGFNLAQALGDGRLAVADPASVPAGKYAKAALTALGVWDSVATRLAPAENVRAALLLVARGEAPLGIVYQTDAMADANVQTVGVFPESTHPPIVYPAALTTRASDHARQVLGCLAGPTARPVFERHGFTAVTVPSAPAR